MAGGVKRINCSVSQSFGVAEGGRVEDMKNMAKAAGQPIPEYTPPEGETMDQVRITVSAMNVRITVSATFYILVLCIMTKGSALI